MGQPTPPRTEPANRPAPPRYFHSTVRSTGTGRVDPARPPQPPDFIIQIDRSWKPKHYRGTLGIVVLKNHLALKQMRFSRSLTTDEMALYVMDNFEWYRREVAFPPLHLLFDYEDLCPGRCEAGRAAWVDDWHNGVNPQRVALEHLLGMGRAQQESDLGGPEALCDSEERRRAWGRMTKPPSPVMAARSEAWLAMTFGTCILCMADHVKETFKWHFRRALRPPRPLPEDYRDLCLGFTLPDAEETACDFNIPEIVQATFYAILVNDAVELFVLSREMVGDLKSTLKGLRWTTFESWMSVNKPALLEEQLCQRTHYNRLWF
ncbi:LOW QUALITY PROTEIN: hypothetical protein Cgig2_018035 [Carnegiea gigantea]|uniref:Uncharacterized protein n=1 Tax=Carnegiea gigantea TaxID=171969 RepID=A0A9Q1Q9R5_9CARY|nr:LOW QUALITY PROTEIN: hypothetical protein Cgig2_018035 [Carnegiea gigantea]